MCFKSYAMVNYKTPQRGYKLATLKDGYFRSPFVLSRLCQSQNLSQTYKIADVEDEDLYVYNPLHKYSHLFACDMLSRDILNFLNCNSWCILQDCPLYVLDVEYSGVTHIGIHEESGYFNICASNTKILGLWILYCFKYNNGKWEKSFGSEEVEVTHAEMIHKNIDLFLKHRF